MSIPTNTVTPPSRRRRRGQGNPLLLKIFGIAVIIHLIALPILAHFGAFKKVQQQFLDTKLVVLPPPEKVKVAEKTETKKAQPKVVRHTAPNPNHAPAPSAAHSGLAQPKVVAAAGGSANGDGDNGPTVDASGTGIAGQLPGSAKVATPPEPTPAPEPIATGTETTAKPMPMPTPVPVPSPMPTPTPEATPKPPVFTEAVPLEEIKPTIPDSLRTEALEATVVVEFAVGADGVPTGVKIAESSNNADLDELGLKTARQWRFKPATRDGEPVETVIRLHIAFQVN